MISTQGTHPSQVRNRLDSQNRCHIAPVTHPRSADTASAGGPDPVCAGSRCSTRSASCCGDCGCCGDLQQRSMHELCSQRLEKNMHCPCRRLLLLTVCSWATVHPGTCTPAMCCQLCLHCCRVQSTTVHFGFTLAATATAEASAAAAAPAATPPASPADPHRRRRLPLAALEMCPLCRGRSRS